MQLSGLVLCLPEEGNTAMGAEIEKILTMSFRWPSHISLTHSEIRLLSAADAELTCKPTMVTSRCFAKNSPLSQFSRPEKIAAIPSACARRPDPVCVA